MKALVTGITGQDGSYLAELLLAKGYEVHGIIRRSSSFNTARIDHIYQDPHGQEVRLFLHHGDLLDLSGLTRVLETVGPEEIYHLGAQSHVRVSFDQPVYTADVDALGTLRLLEAVRRCCPRARFYQASSSEIYGDAPAPQDERTPFSPRSPYAVAKTMAHHAVVNYREAYGLHACCGILFNHESPRRGETFVTRKVTRAATRIRTGLQERLFLGNLDARRDWGFAPDYVEAMWRILRHDTPEDFVIATGESRSVRDLCAAAFGAVGLEWERYVTEDPRYRRPTEVDHLRGNAAKARRVLGWEPTVTFDEMIARMVAADLRLAERERLLADSGHDVRDGSGA